MAPTAAENAFPVSLKLIYSLMQAVDEEVDTYFLPTPLFLFIGRVFYG
jgi:hypothetical protein